LFYEIIHIAKHHKLPALLLENMKAILTIDNGNMKREIYDSLDTIGYKVHHSMLNAGNFGTPPPPTEAGTGLFRCCLSRLAAWVFRFCRNPSVAALWAMWS